MVRHRMSNLHEGKPATGLHLGLRIYMYSNTYSELRTVRRIAS